MTKPSDKTILLLRLVEACREAGVISYDQRAELDGVTENTPAERVLDILAAGFTQGRQLWWIFNNTGADTEIVWVDYGPTAEQVAAAWCQQEGKHYDPLYWYAIEAKPLEVLEVPRG